MERELARIEFFRNVPISPDFKRSPLFSNEAEQKNWFDRYKDDSLTFDGSYQRVEEQIKTKHKYERLLGVNYVRVTNNYKSPSSFYNQWYGFVMDAHYINDGLTIVDWVVDPVQTYHFRMIHGQALIERGMAKLTIEKTASDSEKLYTLDSKKSPMLSNSEPIGHDGLAYYLHHDDVLKTQENDISEVTFAIVTISDAENRSFVGTPSQLDYYVLPYNKINGELYNFEISNVKTVDGIQTVIANNNASYNINRAIDALANDMELTKGGQAVYVSYMQNIIGFDFSIELRPNGKFLVGRMSGGEWHPYTLGKSKNVELYEIGSAGDGSGGDGGSGGGGTGDYTGGNITNAGYTISQANINLVLKYARQRDLVPSFMITQMFIESHWGDPGTSLTGDVDKNWAGISMPFSPPSGVTITQGTERGEGGYYARFATLDDFFNSFAFVISDENGLYKCQGKTTLDSYTKALFIIGGAKSNYAEGGYDHYKSMMDPTHAAIINQNPGKYEALDALR